MPRASLDKGRRFRQLVVGWWREMGYDAYQRGLGESGDDMILPEVPGVSFELKAYSEHRLAEFMHQAVAQAKGRVPVVIMKRKGIGAAPKQWVLMELAGFERLLRVTRLPGHPEDDAG